jgi:hypothetical protein
MVGILRLVVSGSGDGTMRVWDFESGQTLRTLKDRSDRLKASLDLKRRRWKLENGRTLPWFSDLIKELYLEGSGST